MKYAIARIGGKQLKLSEGETFEIERQKDLKFEVIYYNDGNQVLVGNPVLEEIEIHAVLMGEKKGLKVNTGRFRAKSRYQKNKSHRQPLSVVKVEFVGLKGQRKVEIKEASVRKMESVEKTEEKKKTVKSRVKKAELATSKPVEKIAKTTKIKKEKK